MTDLKGDPMTAEAAAAESTAAETEQVDVPHDYGQAQRFLLAERLYNQTEPGGKLSLFDEPASTQQLWLRVANEAIAALVEEPRNE